MRLPDQRKGITVAIRSSSRPASAIFVAAVGMALGAIPVVASAQAKAPAMAAPAVTAARDVSPDAVAALNEMASFLRSLKQFELRVDGYRELVTDDGQKLQFHTVSVYRASLPDKLAVETRSLFSHDIALYDGKTLALVLPDAGVYAEVPFTGTVDKMLLTMRNQYGLDFPVQDMFRWGTDSSILGAPKQAMIVGPDLVQGWLTMQYAVRLEGLDIQIWLDQGDRKIPRRLVITDLSDPTHPQYTANFTWDLNPKINDVLFSLPSAPVAGGTPPRKVPMEEATRTRQQQAQSLIDGGSRK